MSPRLENVENVETDLQNDSDVYTETWEENGYKFRYTDLTRRANGQTKQQADTQANEQADEQADSQATKQAEEKKAWIWKILVENGYWDLIQAGQTPGQAAEQATEQALKQRQQELLQAAGDSDK